MDKGVPLRNCVVGRFIYFSGLNRRILIKENQK